MDTEFEKRLLRQQPLSRTAPASPIKNHGTPSSSDPMSSVGFLVFLILIPEELQKLCYIELCCERIPNIRLFVHLSFCHLNTLLFCLFSVFSRESDSTITNVRPSVSKTPQQLEIILLHHSSFILPSYQDF